MEEEVSVDEAHRRTTLSFKGSSIAGGFFHYTVLPPAVWRRIGSTSFTMTFTQLLLSARPDVHITFSKAQRPARGYEGPKLFRTLVFLSATSLE